MRTKTKYKIQTIWKIDTPMYTRQQALSEAKKRFESGNKNIFGINVIVKRVGAEEIIKTYEREVKEKTETQL
jgi:hypothetical protein